MSNRTKKFDINIANYNIEFPSNGLFVALEWLKPEKCFDGSISPLIELKETNTNLLPLFFSNGKWHINPFLKGGLNISIEAKVFSN